MLEVRMARVLVIGEDWQARALLRAQLLEEGVTVEAYESVAAGLETLETPGPLPALVLADLSASHDPAAEIELLAAWAGRIPVWIIAARSLIAESRLKGRGFELILFRPVDVGELVSQIKGRLER
jgi:CheY-like chemotaxis protein